MIFETGHCDECGTPIGAGSCRGCIAYSAVVAQEDYPPEEEEDADEEMDDNPTDELEYKP